MKNNCVFCQSRKTDSFRVFYEDDLFYGMLVLHPVTYGHAIIVPKKHYSNLASMGKLLPKMMQVAQVIAERNIKKLKAKAYTLKVNNNVYLLEKGDTMHVGHIHVHIIPRYSPNDSDRPKETSIAALTTLSSLLKVRMEKTR